ncbi:MAG: nitroreductase family protein [Actinobacteria bacterium]|nr:nitroreductase family protein [Actinomycetota bacterium]
MRTTPATRTFSDENVPDDVLYRILDHARFAPSGGNRQGWHVVVLRDPALRRRIQELYGLGWREYMAHADEGLVPFAPREQGRWTSPAVDLEAAREVARPHNFADNLASVPVLLLLVADLAALACVDNGLGRQSIAGGGSIYPFGHNILLAARNEGLGGVMTSVLARQEPAVRELIGIPEAHAVAGLIALGHPQRTVRKLRRRPVEEFTTLDRFDGPAFPVGRQDPHPAG